jgi:catechol 2,3-dioxygenase-like lactoylglutathione lyase family enzyme
MTSGTEDDFWAALVPEMLVVSLDRALDFYIGLCGFRLRHARPEEGFAYLALGQASGPDQAHAFQLQDHLMGAVVDIDILGVHHQFGMGRRLVGV